MGFPSDFLDELRSRLSISEVVGRRVSWDEKKSNRGRGDLWACCPFHGEKSPSFHVVESQGFYHCFGCQEHGSAIDFVMKLDRLTFPEAVEMLAGEVGLALPERAPQDAARERRRRGLREANAAAAAFFAQALRSEAGARARAYLERRGLDAATVEAFGLGYAPPGDALTRRLAGEGYPLELLLEGDLSKRSERGGGPYDTFRDRLIFPILDAQGRPIAFGGRALDDKVKPKYLNTGATALFSKSDALYNLKAAREGLRSGAPLIVAEGYMDVIALARGGLPTAVAPMGTALTQAQLELLWRISETPVMALDGDAAGRKAAARALDLALPRLGPGRSLAFAMLPAGQDPDDLLRDSGPEALRKLVHEAAPLIDMLWARERGAHPLDTPERRAALEARCEKLCGAIEDPVVRRHYHFALKDLRFQLFRELRGAPPRAGGAGRAGPGRPNGARRGGGGGAWSAPAAPTEAARQSALALSAQTAEPGAARELRAREAALVSVLLAHPWLAELWQAELDALEMTDPHLDRLKTTLISAAAEWVADRDGSEPASDPSAPKIERRLGPVEIRARALAQAGEDGLALVEAEAERLVPETIRREDAGGAGRQAVDAFFRDALRLHQTALTLHRECLDYGAALSEREAADAPSGARAEGDGSDEDAELSLPVEPSRADAMTVRLAAAHDEFASARAPQSAARSDDASASAGDRLRAFCEQKIWEKRSKRAR